MQTPFPCTQCGCCCKQVFRSELTAYLDKGNGSCKYLSSDNTCSIYEERPDICRVDLQYKVFFSSKMDWEEFVAINIAACNFLQNPIEYIEVL